MNLKKLLKGNGKYIAGGVVVLLVVTSSRKGTSLTKKGTSSSKGKTRGGLTERELRLGLVRGDEELVASVRRQWTALATEIHGVYSNVPVQRILEFIHHESGGHEHARNSIDAQGLMQLMPSARRQYRVPDGAGARDNLRGGVNLLSDLTKKFGDDLAYIAAGYVGGSAGPVKRQFENHTHNFSGETLRYVTRAQALHQLYNEVLA
jgi:soluble lytic murein transglycosylase-like protein